jgi:hypothetical protein
MQVLSSLVGFGIATILTVGPNLPSWLGVAAIFARCAMLMRSEILLLLQYLLSICQNWSGLTVLVVMGTRTFPTLFEAHLEGL